MLNVPKNKQPPNRMRMKKKNCIYMNEWGQCWFVGGGKKIIKKLLMFDCSNKYCVWHHIRVFVWGENFQKGQSQRERERIRLKFDAALIDRFG